MQLIATAIPEVLRLVPDPHRDERGFLAETFRAEWFPGVTFVQENHSLSSTVHTLRGLHFQTPPMAQAKLVRVVRGRALDVAVDVRRRSPTFGSHVALELDAVGRESLFVPAGFAHGFLTLEPDTEVLYKLTVYHSPRHEGGIRWDDPELGIRWGVDDPVISPRDAALPGLDSWTSPFEHRT
ncbi:MAG: dTDP-4-dehydrorhamnose 3,5-epimerase [Acidimicrobiia bacterium]|nr:MAG: dTDP-4-dehydrorhamnose 3,5-epimerase [Acidimicrobiia bacterium]